MKSTKPCEHDYKPLETHFFTIQQNGAFKLANVPRNATIIKRVYCGKCLDQKEIK